MKPLSWIAVGYLLTALSDEIHGYDLLADPLAWVLVLVGVHRLSAYVALPGVRVLAVLAMLVSLPLWVPAVSGAVDDADPSLGWSLSLPALGFVALLCHHVGAAARAAGQRRAGRVFSMLLGLTAIVAVLPVLVFGGHVDGLDQTATALSGLLALAVFLVLLGYAGRPWAGGAAPSTVDAEESARK